MKEHCHNTLIDTYSPDHHHIVTMTLKSLGFRNDDEEDFANYPLIVINDDKFDRYTRKLDLTGLKRVSFEQFLELFYKEETKPIEVVLNKEHTAKVYSNKIVVGCQVFDVDIVCKLNAALVKAKNLKIVDKKKFAKFTYTKPASRFNWKEEVTHRKIQILEETDDYIYGHDVDDNNKVKKFLKSRMSKLTYTGE